MNSVFSFHSCSGYKHQANTMKVNVNIRGVCLPHAAFLPPVSSFCKPNHGHLRNGDGYTYNGQIDVALQFSSSSSFIFFFLQFTPRHTAISPENQSSLCSLIRINTIHLLNTTINTSNNTLIANVSQTQNKYLMTSKCPKHKYL